MNFIGVPTEGVVLLTDCLIAKSTSAPYVAPAEIRKTTIDNKLFLYLKNILLNTDGLSCLEIFLNDLRIYANNKKIDFFSVKRYFICLGNKKLCFTFFGNLDLMSILSILSYLANPLDEFCFWAVNEELALLPNDPLR